MLFKLGLKNLKHDLLMNILIILQMTAAFVILISIISTIASRFRYYEPIKEFLNSKGYFYNIAYGINPDTEMTLRTSDELYEMIDGEKEIAAQYSAWLQYNENSNDRFISYDDRFISIYTPELESGHWFDLSSKVSDIVPVVVSQNNYGLNVGDVIDLYCFDLGIKAEIIGVLAENTKIIDTSHRSADKADYRNFYLDYDLKREEYPVFLMCQRDLTDKQIVMQLSGNIFVTYPDNASDNVIAEGNRSIKRMHATHAVPTEEMKINSLKYIFSQIYDLMPIFVCIFILTIVGAVSTSALSAKRQLKNYAVYYICGLKWRQCAAVNFFSSLVCVMISFVLSIGAAFTVKITGLLGGTVVELGWWQISGCIAMIGVYMILSIILPLNIIGNNTPNQVLKSN